MIVHDDLVASFTAFSSYMTGYNGSLRTNRKHQLQLAMHKAGLGKAWRKKVNGMTLSELARFEAKLRFKASNNLQWNEALRYYTAMRVADALEGKK